MLHSHDFPCSFPSMLHFEAFKIFFHLFFSILNYLSCFCMKKKCGIVVYKGGPVSLLGGGLGEGHGSQRNGTEQ